VPLFGGPASAALPGGKSAGRELGIPVVPGMGNLRLPDEIAQAIQFLGMMPGAHRYVLKLNDSHAGFGNGRQCRWAVGRRPSGPDAHAAGLWP
jgi:hypothetical protein